MPGKSKNLFSKDSHKNTAMLYSMSLALSIDETDGNPLEPKHTGSTLAEDWEAGLGHLSTNTLYSEILAPKFGVAAGPEQKPMRNLLKNYATQIQAAIDKSELGQKDASEDFSKLCGYFYFTPDYWNTVAKSNPSLTFPDGSEIFTRDKKTKKILKYEYTAERGLREFHNVNLKSFKEKLQEAIDQETTVSGVDKKLTIEKYFFKRTEGKAFASQFRSLMRYCPKLAIELQGLSLRLNSTHQGSIYRNELKEHCLGLFEDIFKNEAKVCSYDP